jgi:hypothetical protein
LASKRDLASRVAVELAVLIVAQTELKIIGVKDRAQIYIGTDIVD